MASFKIEVEKILPKIPFRKSRNPSIDEDRFCFIQNLPDFEGSLYSPEGLELFRRAYQKYWLGCPIEIEKESFVFVFFSGKKIEVENEIFFSLIGYFKI